MITTTNNPALRLALLASVAVVAGAGCGEAPDLPGELPQAAAELPQPLTPTFTLQDLNGDAYQFPAAAGDKIVLLFFGYTHCPDICPVHMANIAGALKKLPHRITSQVEVVFVTTDPERDTPQRLRDWLGVFNPDFVGLWGSQAEVDSAAAQLRMPPAVRDTVDDTYFVGHMAYVVGLTRDGVARFIYAGGVRQADWAQEIPRLVSLERDGG